MAYPFDDRTYNRMPFGPPAPFGFGGSILPMPRAQAGNDFGRANAKFPESATGLGFTGSSEPMWQVASSRDSSYPYPRPGYAPPLPDVFAPWKKGAEQSLMDLWKLLFEDRGWRGGGGGSGGGGGEDNEYDCDAERNACAKTCFEASKDSDLKGVWGGSWDKCMRSCLPRKCGGV